MVAGNGDWRWHHFDKLSPLYVLLRIAVIKPLIISASHDVLGWSGNEDRSFTDRHHSFFQQDFESWLHTNLALTDMVVSFNSNVNRESIMATSCQLCSQYCRAKESHNLTSQVVLNVEVSFETSMGLDAELWVVLDGLNHVWQLGYRKVEVELDSLATVRIIKGSTKAGAHSYMLQHIEHL
ncbi:hypothetical protein V6N13_096035 [Hibiscus sabdariffa]